VLRRCRDELVSRAHQLAWVGYLSTTGVYGDHGGGWVDEETPRAPLSERAVRRAEAEDAWLALARDHGVATHVFRLAGIYGPGRNQLAAVLDGTAKRVIKPGQVFSRIHVADIAGVLEASIANPNPGRVYNVADDEPAPPQDVVAFAAKLLGRPAPPEVPFEEAELSPMGRSFYAESKRVDNRRIRQELGYTCLPDLPGGPHGAPSDMTARRSAAAAIVARSRSVDSLWSPPLMSVNDDVVTGDRAIEHQPVFPRHVRIVLPVQDLHRAGDLDPLIKNQVMPPVLDQRPGDRIGLAVLRRPQPLALVHDRGAGVPVGFAHSNASVMSAAGAMSSSPAMRAAAAGYAEPGGAAAALRDTRPCWSRPRSSARR
jgi:hypothetical protein